MTLFSEREPEVLHETTLTDRRRPGRSGQVSPELIPLLRTSDLPANPDEALALEDEDQLCGMRGVASGLVFSVPIWVGIAYVGRWLFT